MGAASSRASHRPQTHGRNISLPFSWGSYTIRNHMNSKQFLVELQSHAQSFAKAVATNEGDWIIKGFIDVYRRIYTISVDTKIISKVLELLLFPMFVEFAEARGLKIELCPQQNFYPDLTFTHERSGRKFAVDIKSISVNKFSSMFTFSNR